MNTYKTVRIPVSSEGLYLYKEPYPVPVVGDEHPDADCDEVRCQHVQVWVVLLLPAEGEVAFQQLAPHVHYYRVHTCTCVGEDGDI